MIKVAVWGTGMMGQGLLGYILDRPKEIELVGVIDRHPEKHGRTVGETIGRECDIPVTADFAQVLAQEARRRVHLHREQPARDHRPGRGLGEGRRQRHLHRRDARVPVGERPRVGRAVRRARQGARRQHPRHRHQPGLRARRAADRAVARCACASTASRPRASTTCRRSAPRSWSRRASAPPSSSSRPASPTARSSATSASTSRSTSSPSALGWKIDRDRGDARADRHDRRARDAAREGRRRRRVRLPPHRVGATAATSSRSSSSTRSRSTPRSKAQETGDYIKHHRRPEHLARRSSPRSPAARVRTRAWATTSRSSATRAPGIVTVVDMPLPRFWAPVRVRETAHD